MKTIKANPLPPPGQPDNPVIPKDEAPPIEKAPIEKAPEKKDDLPNPVIKHDSVFGTEKKPLEKQIDKPVLDDERAELLKGAPEMSTKGTEAWIQNRRENKSLKAQLEEKDRALQELGKKQNVDLETPKKLEAYEQEVATLKAQLEAYEGEISATRVEASKDFIQSVSKPKAELEQRAAAIAKKNELSERKLLELLREPFETRNELLNELTEGMKDIDKMELVQISRELERIDRIAEEKRTEAKTKKLHVEQQQQQVLTQASEEYKSTASQKAEQAYREAIAKFPQLAGETGNQDWDTFIAQNRKNIISAPLENAEEAGRIKAIAATAEPYRLGYEHMKGKFDEAQSEIELLTKRLQAYEGSEPNNGGRGGDDSPPADTEKPQGLGALTKGLVSRYGGVSR